MEIKKSGIFSTKININNIYFILYGLELILGIFSRSTFSFSRLALKAFNIILLLSLIIVIFFVKHNIYELTWLAMGIGISCIIFYFTRQNDFFFIILMLFSFRKMSPKMLLQLVVMISSVMLLILFICSKLNYIPNLFFFRNLSVRESFGTQYPLVFSTYIFSICSALTMLYGRKNRFILSILFIVVILVLDKFTNSRNDEISILLLILIIWLTKLSNKVLKSIANISIILYPIIVIISIFITQFIPYTSNIYLTLNQLFSGRLGLQSQIISLYKIRFFGNNIPQIGLGGQKQAVMNYLYIDNSYMRFLYMGGILFFIFILFTIIFTLIKLNNCNLSSIVMILLIIGFNGISSDSIYYLNTAILLPLFFIAIPNYLKDLKD